MKRPTWVVMAFLLAVASCGDSTSDRADLGEQQAAWSACLAEASSNLAECNADCAGPDTPDGRADTAKCMDKCSMRNVKHTYKCGAYSIR